MESLLLRGFLWLLMLEVIQGVLLLDGGLPRFVQIAFGDVDLVCEWKFSIMI